MRVCRVQINARVSWRGSAWHYMLPSRPSVVVLILSVRTISEVIWTLWWAPKSLPCQGSELLNVTQQQCKSTVWVQSATVQKCSFVCVHILHLNWLAPFSLAMKFPVGSISVGLVNSVPHPGFYANVCRAKQAYTHTLDPKQQHTWTVTAFINTVTEIKLRRIWLRHTNWNYSSWEISHSTAKMPQKGQSGLIYTDFNIFIYRWIILTYLSVGLVNMMQYFSNSFFQLFPSRTVTGCINGLTFFLFYFFFCFVSV